jgi:hypothetical protein
MSLLKYHFALENFANPHSTFKDKDHFALGGLVAFAILMFELLFRTTLL